MNGLEALEVIAGDNSYCDEEIFYYNKAIVEKSLKALEIIKNKQVDVCELKICIDEYEDSLYQYNKRTIEKFRLTEEEFNLLKEVLE